MYQATLPSLLNSNPSLHLWQGEGLWQTVGMSWVHRPSIMSLSNGARKPVTMVMGTYYCCNVYLLVHFYTLQNSTYVIRTAENVSMSRQNTTFWPKVGKMGVGKMGIGEQGISPWRYVVIACCTLTLRRATNCFGNREGMHMYRVLQQTFCGLLVVHVLEEAREVCDHKVHIPWSFFVSKWQQA